MEKKNSLPRMVRVETAYIRSFSSATHTLFHSNQYDLVAKVEQSKLNISADLLASWKANIDMEVEINKQSMLSALTREMEAKDAERDRILTQLFGLIRIHRLSFVEAERKPAERLYAALKTYFGIQTEAFGDETIHIVGLLKDTERFTAEVTALGLTALLAQLKMVNEEYKKLDAQRRSDLVAAKLPDARSARRQTDADFEVICQCIQASYMLAATKEDKALILTLVNEMNRVASDLKPRTKPVWRKGNRKIKRNRAEATEATGKLRAARAAIRVRTEKARMAEKLPTTAKVEREKTTAREKVARRAEATTETSVPKRRSLLRCSRHWKPNLTLPTIVWLTAA